MIQNKIDYSLLDQLQQVEVDSILATKLLSKNKCNRQIKQNTVFQYVSDMKNGGWRQYSPPIIINGNGELLDGQHRLQAIVYSGLSILCRIWIIPDNTLKPLDIMVDRGKIRSYSDILNIDREIISVIRRLLRNSTYGSGINPTLDEVNKFYDYFIRDDEVIQELLRRKIAPLWNEACCKSIALCYYLINEQNKEYIINLINSIISKDIHNQEILQLAYMKLSAKRYNEPELIRLSIQIFNPTSINCKTLRIQPNISIGDFYKSCLNSLNFHDYYLEKLSINKNRNKIYYDKIEDNS